MKQYNWGIIGTGSISHLFAQGLRYASGANLYCVASRSKQKADAFARSHNIPVAYGSYEELAEDPHVEIVYIGTPNSFHCDNSLLCLQKKKAVLCEKPFALNAGQVEKMIYHARKNNCFLMEALWSRFLPSIQKVQWLVDNKVVGDPICIKADFGFLADYNEESRLFNPLLGGGSLLDIGIYPVFLAYLLFGYPDEISSHAVIAPTGVDLSTGIFLSWKSGQFAQLASSFNVDLDTEAVIYCSKGKITLHRKFHMPTRLSISTANEHKEISLDWKGNGYNYEAEEVMYCLSEGRLESQLLPLNFSLELMKLLQTIMNVAKKVPVLSGTHQSNSLKSVENSENF
jgi:predicted dehydrogenase